MPVKFKTIRPALFFSFFYLSANPTKKDQNQQLYSPSLNTFQLHQPVCGTQPCKPIQPNRRSDFFENIQSSLLTLQGMIVFFFFSPFFKQTLTQTGAGTIAVDYFQLWINTHLVPSWVFYGSSTVCTGLKRKRRILKKERMIKFQDNTAMTGNVLSPDLSNTAACSKGLSFKL